MYNTGGKKDEKELIGIILVFIPVQENIWEEITDEHIWTMD
jgi:hypothetical protein